MIRHSEVRLIGEDGSQLGIVSSQKALEIAESYNLDLVEISPQAKPPVCKIMDYGKYRFELLKKQKEAKKNQKVIELKEIWSFVPLGISCENPGAPCAAAETAAATAQIATYLFCIAFFLS